MERGIDSQLPPLRPQLQVAEDLLDHAPVVDQSDDLHLGAAVAAAERVEFPNLFDELAPLF